jgi:hypothetical protein
MRPALVAGMALLALPIPALAQTSATPEAARSKPPLAIGPRLVGMWRLVSTRQQMADGTTRSDPDLGSRPAGYMIYDAAGRMCTVFNNSDRPRWTSSPPTEADLRAGFDGMVVYCASYEVDEARGYIVFHMEFGQSPNLAGTSRERKAVVVGDHLTLYPNPLPAGVTAWTIDLERVRP